MEITNYFDKFNNSDKELIIEERYFNEDTRFVMLGLKGLIDTYNTIPFYDNIKKFLALEERLVLVLDMNSISYMSSTGIGIFLQIDKDCKAGNIKLYLMGIRKNVDEVFSLLGFKMFFNYITELNDIKEEKIIRSIFPQKIKCPNCGITLKISKIGAFKCTGCLKTFRIVEKNNNEIGVNK